MVGRVLRICFFFLCACAAKGPRFTRAVYSKSCSAGLAHFMQNRCADQS
jgi:hypothetical protein